MPATTPPRELSDSVSADPARPLPADPPHVRSRAHLRRIRVSDRAVDLQQFEALRRAQSESSPGHASPVAHRHHHGSPYALAADHPQETGRSPVGVVVDREAGVRRQAS